MSTLQLQVSNLAFQYDTSPEPLFDDLSVSLSPGFTALVGSNGAGKTTLLRLLCEQLAPVRGSIHGPESRLYCRQTSEEPPSNMDEFYTDMYSGENTAGRLFSLLRLDHDWPWRWDSLSYGERKRAQISCALYARPDVLLLDEPTNHLDEQGMEILLEGLRTYQGIALVVSHDRTFLDGLCTASLFLAAGRAVLRPGSLSAGLQQQELEAATARHNYELQRQELQRLQHQVQLQKEKADRHQKDFSKRGIAARDHDARSRIDGLRITNKDALGGKLTRRIENRVQAAEVRLQQQARPDQRKLGITLSVRNSSKSFLLQQPAGTLQLSENSCLEYPDLSIRPGERIALNGANGSGKTSLIRHLFPHSNDARLYLPQELPADSLRELEAALSELPDARKGILLAYYSRLNGDPASTGSLARMSSGEQRKLYLAWGLLRECELIILDEPTNHLDLPSRTALEGALDNWPGAMLLVSHDRAFREQLCHTVWNIESADNSNSSNRNRLSINI